MTRCLQRRRFVRALYVAFARERRLFDRGVFYA